MLMRRVTITGAMFDDSTDIALGPVTAITGPTGSGKTQLLHLIHRTRETVAPYGGSPTSLHQLSSRRDVPGVRVTVALGFDENEQQRFGVQPVEEIEATQLVGSAPQGDARPEAIAALRAYGHQGEHGFVEIVPSCRESSSSFMDMGVASQRSLRASEAATKYAWAESFLADVALCVPISGAPAPSIADVNALFAEARCPLRLDHAVRVGSTHAPVLSLFGNMVCGLSRLPAGCRQIASLVALVALTKPRRSVFLVDDLDRDLDESLQIGALDLLRRGGNQVVFSTRSAVLLGAAAVTNTVQLRSPGAH